MSAVPPPFPIIPGNMLDYYLGQGYYRMHQDLFTCRFLPISDTLHTVHWLRLALDNVTWGPEQRRLLRLNEPFDVSIQPFRLTDEYETLYAQYRASITFDAPPSVEAFLLAGATHNIFTTEVLEVRDNGQLIATGIFDSGTRSLAGIMNFYDPAYRKNSLGKYLMLLKINHARARHMQYYYPGYLVHDYPKFDYKLFPCLPAMEVFDCLRDQWLPFTWDEVNRQATELMLDWDEQELD